MRRLDSLAPRQLSRRRGRTLMTAGGTALGVAVLFAVLVATSGATRALDRSLAGQAGRADVVVGPTGSWDAPLPAGAAERVAAIDGVDEVFGALNIRALLERPGSERSLDSRSGIIILVATEVELVSSIKEYALVEGRNPAQGAAEITLSRKAAHDVGVGIGDSLDITTSTGRRAVTLVGVIDDAGAGLSYQGAVGYTSFELGWQLDGRAGTANNLDVVLTDGVDVDAWIDLAEPQLAGMDAVAAEDVAAGFADFIAGITTGMTLLSAIALFVGGFLVFLTFSLAVAERTRVFGTLRALGALPTQVRRLVVVEAAALGSVASVVGLGLGYVLASAAYGLIGSLFDLTMPSIGLPIGPALFSVGIGVVISVLAAWLPGRRAARIGPLDAMRSGAQAVETKGRLVPRIALLGVGMLAVFLDLPASISAVAVLLLLLGAVLCVPFALGPAAGVVGRATQRIGRGIGAISVMHLVKERSRSAYTLALIMVVLAMLVAVAGTNVSASQAIDDLLDKQGQNIQVGAPSAFDPAVGDELAALPGVAAVTPVRFGRGSVVDGERDVQVGVTVVEPDSYFAISSFDYADGDDTSAHAALAAGGSVLLPRPMAEDLGASIGDTVTIRTFAPEPSSFTLAGTFDQVGGGFDAVVGIADTDKFGSGRPNLFLVRPVDDAQEAAVVDAIAASVGSRYALVLDTPAGTRSYARGQLNGFFALAYVVLGLAGVIGMLGLANTLGVSVLARTREIGILRSAGTVRRQIWAMVVVEALTLTVVAFAFAAPLGAVLSIGTIATGLGFVYPWGFLLPLAVMTLIVSVLASIVPARAAGRLEPVAALRFD